MTGKGAELLGHLADALRYTKVVYPNRPPEYRIVASPESEEQSDFEVALKSYIDVCIGAHERNLNERERAARIAGIIGEAWAGRHERGGDGGGALVAGNIGFEIAAWIRNGASAEEVEETERKQDSEDHALGT